MINKESSFLANGGIDLEKIDLEAYEFLCLLWSSSYIYNGNLIETKGCIARVDGLKLYIYSDEHAPPHFHVISSDSEAIFRISDCILMKGSLSGKEKVIERWYTKYKNKLINEWNRLRPTDCPVGKIKDS